MLNKLKLSPFHWQAHSLSLNPQASFSEVQQHCLTRKGCRIRLSRVKRSMETTHRFFFLAGCTFTGGEAGIPFFLPAQ